LLAAITLVTVGKVVTFLVMLSILIVLHEYGHFLLARRNRVKVNEFAIGMGPRVGSWRSPRSGTIYSIRALPIGGFCAMEGEDGKTSEAEQQREFRSAATASEVVSENFQAKTPLQRLVIVLAGPLANFILAYVVLLVGALAFGVASGTIDQAVVTKVVPGWPAALNGMKAGDRIVEVTVNGKSVTKSSKLIDELHASLGKRIDVVFERNGVRHLISVTPKPCPQNRQLGCIGFAPAPAFVHVGFADAVRESADEYANIADQTVSSLGLLVTHFSTYANQVSGPIGMGEAAATIQDFGWGPYFALAATISFALGLFNLLPLPALDGGRAAFIIAELLRGRPVDPEKEALVHIAGFAALMALMIVVALHDIARIASGQGVF
jgi:regulator of sigma E protease